VQNAWARVQARRTVQPDHVSTHIYAALYVDKPDRSALRAWARRTFAATDNVIVDFRMGDHFMGESLPAGPLRRSRLYQGTGLLAAVTL
jgi:hypothetical protein